MKSATEIRDLQPGDEKRLVEIARAAWVPVFESWRHVLGTELFDLMHSDWEDVKAKQVLDVCKSDSPGTVLVAQEDGLVAGFVTYYLNAPKDGVAEIGNNAVHPDFQRRGTATKMYCEVLRRLRTVGIKYVLVCTGGDPPHLPARKAYEGVGFNIEIPGVEYYRRL